MNITKQNNELTSEQLLDLDSHLYDRYYLAIRKSGLTLGYVYNCTFLEFPYNSFLKEKYQVSRDAELESPNFESIRLEFRDWLQK